MAKRFIDTNLFDDSWFMELTKDSKLTWLYLITKCDHAGIIEINEKLFKFITGVTSFKTVSKELGNRLVSLRNNYYFIPKFIEYQYPNFPNSNVKQQQGAIKRLKEFNLYDEKNLSVIKELSKSYGNGNDIGIVNENEKPTFEEFKNYAKTKKEHVDIDKLKIKFEMWNNNNWHDGNGKKIINWKSKLNNTLPYIEEKRTSPKLAL